MSLECDFFTAEEIFSEYSGFIWSVIRSNIKTEWEQEDLYQFFFLSLLKKPIPKSVPKIKRFIYRSLINDIIDYKRKKEMDSYHIQNHIQSLSLEDQRSPEDKTVKCERNRKILSIIENNLTKSESTAITLRFKDNLPNHEIARLMNVNNESIYRYISVGLKRLRKYFKNSEFQDA